MRIDSTHLVSMTNNFAEEERERETAIAGRGRLRALRVYRVLETVGGAPERT